MSTASAFVLKHIRIFEMTGVIRGILSIGKQAQTPANSLLKSNHPSNHETTLVTLAYEIYRIS